MLKQCTDDELNVLRNSLKKDSIARVSVNIIDNKLDYNKKLKEFASNKLLELKNDCWLDEDENAMSKDDFIMNIDIYNINVSPGGDFTIYCDDNDMFLGHSIIISGNINTGLETANI